MMITPWRCWFFTIDHRRYAPHLRTFSEKFQALPARFTIAAEIIGTRPSPPTLTVTTTSNKEKSNEWKVKEG